MKARNDISVAGRHGDLRQLVVHGLKIRPLFASMAIQYMMIRPQTTDPSALGVRAIVEGIQGALRRRGFDVPATGRVDARTDEVLCAVAGEDWQARDWMQVAADVLAAPPVRRSAEAAPRPPAMGGIASDFFWSPVGMLAVAGAVWYFARGRNSGR